MKNTVAKATKTFKSINRLSGIVSNMIKVGR
jgi:hypothetical protein